MNRVVGTKGRMIEVKILEEEDHKIIDLKEILTRRIAKEKVVQGEHSEVGEVMEEVEMVE